jgi:hypothetical protein
MSIVFKNLFIQNKLGFTSLFKKTFSTRNNLMKSSNLTKFKLYSINHKHFTIANLRGNLAEQEEILLNKEREKLTTNVNYLISDFKDKKINNKTIPFEKLVEIMEIIDKTNEVIRQDSENFLLEILRDSDFYRKYFNFPIVSNAHQNFANFFWLAPRLRNLEDQDLKLLNETFFKMDNKIKEFSIEDRIKIYDAFYYYVRNFGEERVLKIMGDMHEKITNSFLEFFTSFSHEDVMNLLKNIVFLEDKEIQKFVKRMKDRLLYVFNEDYGKKLGLTFSKKFDLVQFYPRIIHSIKKSDPELFEKEKLMLESFLIQNSTSPSLKELNEEMVLCAISNYLVWTCKNEKVFESYMNYFYNNLSSFRNELLIELFFLLLNSDFKNFKNIKLPVSMLNLIYQLIKNLKPDQFAVFEDTKEMIYFKKIRKALIENFDKWDEKYPADTPDSPDYYHKKILREFIKKSIDMYPFASIDYSEETFDRIFENLKNYIKFR